MTRLKVPKIIVITVIAILLSGIALCVADVSIAEVRKDEGYYDRKDDGDYEFRGHIT